MAAVCFEDVEQRFPARVVAGGWWQMGGGRWVVDGWLVVAFGPPDVTFWVPDFTFGHLISLSGCLILLLSGQSKASWSD